MSLRLLYETMRQKEKRKIQNNVANVSKMHYLCRVNAEMRELYRKQ